MLPTPIDPAAPREGTASRHRSASSGQGLVEYALLVALVSLLLIPGLIFLQGKQSALFEGVGGALRGPAAESVAPGNPNPETVPDSQDDCKNGGWQSFNPPGGAFTSQGDCVSWANTNGR
jgi:Flp pilus assembly pilin Flp